ncbi:MAG: LptF/LptG family permease, partial [Rectinema sp.]
QGFKNEYAELIKKSAKIELAPYSISKYGDKLLVTGGSEEGSSASRLQDVLIIDQSGGYDSDTVIADDVGIEFSKDSLMAILSMNSLTELKRLNDASAGDFSVTMAKSAEIRIRIREPLMNYSSTAPSEMSLTILAKKIKEKERILDDRIKKKDFQKDTALDRLRLNYDLLAIETQQERSLKTKDSLTSLTLLQNDLISLTNKIKSLENQKINDTSLQIYRLEYEKKLVLPSACFFFALLALPLGIGSKRAGRAAGFGIALLLSVIYWALLFLGQTLGYRQNVNPVFSMWMPNLVMLLATISLWVVRKIKTGHFL